MELFLGTLRRSTGKCLFATSFSPAKPCGQLNNVRYFGFASLMHQTNYCTPISNLTRLSLKHYSNGLPSSTITNQDNVGTKALKLVGWLGGFYSRKAILTRSAKSMYECCVENVIYEDFYEAANMPDTFQSWFLISQLHVWMCLVRLKAEKKDGRYMYRKLVQIFWDDVEERMKVMGVTDGSVRKNGLKELTQEFYGLILAYDEGLLSHDRVLAASLWRNLIHDKKCTDASKLAKLVDYVRRQTLHLESIDSEHLLTTGSVEWLPFESYK